MVMKQVLAPKNAVVCIFFLTFLDLYSDFTVCWQPGFFLSCSMHYIKKIAELRFLNLLTNFAPRIEITMAQ